MPANLDVVFIIGSILVLLAVFVSKITDRYGIPLLLLFLILGMLSGSEGLGGIYFDDPELTQWIATVALAGAVAGADAIPDRWLEALRPTRCLEDLLGAEAKDIRALAARLAHGLLQLSP